jgi:hypothetical protein
MAKRQSLGTKSRNFKNKVLPSLGSQLRPKKLLKLLHLLREKPMISLVGLASTVVACRKEKT